MYTFMFAGFIILHGLVHLLYVGQASGIFELRPGMSWPDSAWLLSRMFGDRATRWVAAITLILAAFGFVAGGFGLIFSQAWWYTATVGAALLSSVMIILLWDGTLRKMDDQGGVGLLINLLFLVLILFIGWPTLG